ncbi:LysM peptidoglycan-binding domain-containing protein [Streptomyces gilvus]|uniref:LysM peptidoglycan-binding domain-containing protein n=1 Tax=Streptomyces gilvus TaxID=2920937 RepID=UPI001F11689D|nr:LysM peptidoglycan-binding domain-containing protein [Streptomyces sp. CME 23]MCH5677313.1 LysM peptidoglycan-binding domain-containing protein [Streptomyces sp. CME 23]
MPATARIPAPTAARTLARVLKAAVSLLVLAAATCGLPVLLAWATPAIWAATHDDLTHLLHRQDTGSVFLLFLACVGWIGWAQFAFCAVRELIAQLRGRTWHAPRGMGATQRAAALLIGSILVLLPTSSALASDAQAAPATTAAPIPGKPQARQAAETEQASTSSATTTASSPSYTVREMRPAQSLWGIAERELGDGERWREIADLNEGHTMADGTIFRANSFLQPGWQLQMPATPTEVGGLRTQLGEAAPTAGEESEHVVTVRSGDYLSKIAEKELGDGDDWPQLFEASRDTPQPHGLPAITDPNIIYAGQQVTVPAAHTGQPPQGQGHDGESGGQESPPPATQNPNPTQPPGDSTGNAPAPAPGQTTTPAPRSSAATAPSRRPAEQPGQDQSSPPAAASARPEPPASASASSAATPPASAEPSGSAASPAPGSPPAPAPATSPLNLRIVLGAGALLAAAVTGALALRRTLQRRRRKPGETIAIAAEPSPAEAQLAAAAEPGGAARLDVALQTLAHHVAQQEEHGAVLPPLRAARIATRAVQVLPEDLAQQPVAPFTAGRAGWWVLPAEAALLDEEAACAVSAPYPGLVTIGHTAAGELLLLNLAALPALLLDGNPVHITEVCTSLALELAMSPWATDVEVVTVGFGEDLPQLLPTTRIAHMRQAAHALRDLSERLLEAHQMPESRHQPYLLLCASALDEDTAWQFADVISRAGAVPVTLIAPASTAAARFPEAEILNASLNQPQTLNYVGTDITVQRLQHAAYLQITTALKVSGQPSHPAEDPWEDVPDEPDRMPQTGQASREKPFPAPMAGSIPSPAAETDASGEVFPALLAAGTDPSGLRLLSPTPSPPPLDDATGPDTEAAVLPAPAYPTTGEATDTAKTAKAHTPGAALEEPAAAKGDAYETPDLNAPEIRVLGPVEVTGVDNTGHGPRTAQLAALLYLRPGRTADVLCADMDPVSPWSTSTLNARMQGLRSALGSDSSGTLYVPRRKTGEDPYRLAPAVRCDWTRFLHLVEHALPQGPSGLTGLEKALALVRGKPFGGRPLPWAEPYAQDMTTRITDIAHTVATHRTPAGPHHDLNAARQAITTGLDADPTAELLYRDWMRLEAARGNRSGLHTAITRLQQINRELDCSPEPETEQLINHLLNSPRPGRTPTP